MQETDLKIYMKLIYETKRLFLRILDKNHCEAGIVGFPIFDFPTIAAYCFPYCNYKLVAQVPFFIKS